MKRHDFLGEHQERRRRHGRLKWYGLAFLLLALASGTAVLFVRAPLFQIRNFTVSGAPASLSREDLVALVTASLADDRRFAFLGAGHYFAWPATITFASGDIRSVRVEKRPLARAVHLAVTVRESFGIWCFAGGACVWVDAEEGIVMREAPEPDGTLVPSFRDPREAPPLKGTPVLPSRQFANVRQFVSELQAHDLGFTAFSIDAVREELQAELPGGARVLFSLRDRAPDEAIAALRALAAREPLTRYEYVDLTVEGRVYVKRK